MQMEEHRWHSPNLGRAMNLRVYGHWGQPYVVFPCSRGRYFDYEGMGMISAIADHIDRGQIKLFCLDSVDEASWYNFRVSPAERNACHEAYDRYVVAEAVPFIRDHCRLPEGRIMANGCSMGAYHAVNFLFKHPDVFEGVIALSGLYRLDRPEFGLSAADLPAVYFNSPLSYLPGLGDSWYLERYRSRRIIVCAGQGAWEEEVLDDTQALEAVCRAKAIPGWFDVWGPDVNHDWPWWYRQMNYFLTQLYGA